MGSYISIGFVYEKKKKEKIAECLEKLIDFINLKNENIERIKYCEDDFGEIEYEVNLKDIIYHKNEVLKKIVEYYYGEIEFYVNIFGIEKLKMVLKIEKEEEFYGIVLEVEESDIISQYTVDNINSITEKIIDFMVNIYPYLNYDYVVCDNELELKYSPKIMRNMKELKYSILVIYDSKLKIIKSNWNIDGLTERK